MSTTSTTSSLPTQGDLPPFLPLPEVDQNCRLLGPTALVVQALMGVLVLGSLLYKRHREKPKRAWKIWIFDVSKQVVGQIVVHIANVFISWMVARRSLENPCVMYFLNILIDTTVGVGLIYLFLHYITQALSAGWKLRGFQSGVYGDPPSLTFWGRQTMVYLGALLAMKIVVVVLFAVFPWLIDVGDWLLSWTGNRGAVQVIFVMGLFPIAMNILQFWLIDSIVKFKVTTTLSRSPDDEALNDDPAREHLVGSSSDDEDDLDDTDQRMAKARRSTSLDIEARGRPIPRTSSIESGLVSKHQSHSVPHTRDSSPHNYPPSIASSLPKHIPRRSPPPSPSPAPSYGAVEARESWESLSDADGGRWEGAAGKSAGDEDARRKSLARGDTRESLHLPTLHSPTASGP